MAAVAAHQVVLQVWEFLSLLLDSLAIAAQSLVPEDIKHLYRAFPRNAHPMAMMVGMTSPGDENTALAGDRMPAVRK